MTPPLGPHKVIILKLGGSLITDKTQRDVVHNEVVQNFAALLARYCAARPEQILIIVGGGSVGHFAAREAHVNEGFLKCDSKSLHRMASKMYRLKVDLAESLARYGLPTMPFQETSYMVATEDGRIALHDLPIRHALKLKMVPILSGGLIFDESRGVRALSGDLLPLSLDPEAFHIRRVIMLTDVPGVLADDGSTISQLDAASRMRMARLDTSVSRIDVTGGMNSKVDAALALAQRGIPCVISSGTSLDYARLEILLSGLPENASLAGFPATV